MNYPQIALRPTARIFITFEHQRYAILAENVGQPCGYSARPCVLSHRRRICEPNPVYPQDSARGRAVRHRQDRAAPGMVSSACHRAFKASDVCIFDTSDIFFTYIPANVVPFSLQAVFLPARSGQGAVHDQASGTTAQSPVLLNPCLFRSNSLRGVVELISVACAPGALLGRPNLLFSTLLYGSAPDSHPNSLLLDVSCIFSLSVLGFCCCCSFLRSFSVRLQVDTTVPAPRGSPRRISPSSRTCRIRSLRPKGISILK